MCPLLELMETGQWKSIIQKLHVGSHTGRTQWGIRAGFLPSCYWCVKQSEKWDGVDRIQGLDQYPVDLDRRWGCFGKGRIFSSCPAPPSLPAQSWSPSPGCLWVGLIELGLTFPPPPNEVSMPLYVPHLPFLKLSGELRAKGISLASPAGFKRIFVSSWHA